MSDDPQHTFYTRTIQLAECTSKIGSGFTPTGGKKQYLASGKVAFVRSQNIYNEGFKHSGLVFIDDTAANKLREVALYKDDVLINITGDSVARCCLAPEDIIPGRVSQHVMIIRPNPEIIDNHFLRYYLVSPRVQQYLLGIAGAGSTRSALTKSIVENLLIPLVPITKQKKIASILFNLDKKIELNNRINAELEAMAQTLYDYWFVQFDFPDENGKPYKSSGGRVVYNPTLKYEIPAGWKEGTLNDLGQIVGGSTPSTKNPNNFTINGIPWITPYDLSNHGQNKFITRGAQDVSNEGIKNGSLKIYPIGTVLLSSRAPIGYMAIARCELTTNQGFKSFIPTNGYPSAFIYYTVKSSLKAIMRYASGSTFKEVSGTVLKTVNICLPSSTVLKHFTSTVEPIFKRQDLLEQENQQLIQLRDWLLPMLMNGQIRVQ